MFIERKNVKGKKIKNIIHPAVSRRWGFCQDVLVWHKKCETYLLDETSEEMIIIITNLHLYEMSFKWLETYVKNQRWCVLRKHMLWQ